MPHQTILNLGGEGEEPGEIINQQPEWVANRFVAPDPLHALVLGKTPLLFCPNDSLPFADESIDHVYSNSVPVDSVTWMGPGVQSAEIKRILKKGGDWQHDGLTAFTKP